MSLGIRVFSLIVLCASFTFAQSNGSFPIGPNPSLTPGSKCSRPSEFRYPEKVPYCDRDVSPALKVRVFSEYQKVGFAFDMNKRNSFKVDHFIPLSLGGSNELNNLWPQHSSIYRITDPIEQLLFNQLSAGKMAQQEAIALIMRAKLNLDEAPGILKRLESSNLQLFWSTFNSDL